MPQKVIIYGGRGALGTVIIKYFKSNSMWVGSIDLLKSEDADFAIALNKEASWETQTKTVLEALQTELGETKVDAIINVAGGWAGGNVGKDDFQKTCELMWMQSVWSSAITAQASGKFLKEGGLLILPGAQPAIQGTPGMIGYGMAKAAVHQLTKSLGMENSGLPKGSTAVALLPITLDTPMNRKWMSGADFTSWTSLDYVAELIHKWLDGENRPTSGSLVQLVTKGGETELIIQ